MVWERSILRGGDAMRCEGEGFDRWSPGGCWFVGWIMGWMLWNERREREGEVVN